MYFGLLSLNKYTKTNNMAIEKIYVWREIKIALITIVGCIIIALIVFKSCSTISKTEIVQQLDTLTPLNKANAIIINKADSSIENRKHRFKLDSLNMARAYNRLLSRYQIALKASPDTCKTLWLPIYMDCLEVDSTDKAAIKRRDSTIADLTRGNIALKNTAHNDTIRINQLQDSIPKVAKSEFKRGKCVGRKQGFVAGVVVDESLRAGVRVLVKP